MGKLTEARIRSLKPANRDRMIGDGNALYLRVRTSGTKTWILRKKHAGQVRIVTLGDYPEKSLAEVRARAGG